MIQLIVLGAIPGNVQYLSYAGIQKDGVKILDLDLNRIFSDFLQSLGSTGEYMAVGSACSTFLDTYDCSKIKITVDGRELMTGDMECLGYI